MKKRSPKPRIPSPPCVSEKSFTVRGSSPSERNKALSAFVHQSERSSEIPFSTSTGDSTSNVIPVASARKTGVWNALDVAKRLIELSSEYGDPVSNLKLQKLLYYAQAWYLAFHGKPLFRDRIEAWVHGPSQPEVYAHFRSWGVKPIEIPGEQPQLPDKIENHLRDTLEAYGRFSAYDLERLSQSESPWQEARKGLATDEPGNSVMDLKVMSRCYRTRLNEQKKAEDSGARRAKNRKDTRP
jgi:uncharacterized phage-associated protein